MSRRGIVLTICLIGAAAIAIFFLRSHKKEGELSSSLEPSPTSSPASTPTRETDEAPQVQDAAKANNKKSPASEESLSAPLAQNEPPPRGARGNHPLGGKKSYDTNGAQTHDDVALTGTGWKVWAGIAAYPKNQGARAGKVLGEVNGYYLVDEGVQASSENFDPAKPMVVLNANKIAGVVTGTIAVTLEEGASAAFLNSSQIKMVGSFPDIQTYYVTSSQVPFNLKEFKDALAEAPEVKSVKVEILDRQYEKF